MPHPPTSNRVAEDHAHPAHRARQPLVKDAAAGARRCRGWAKGALPAARGHMTTAHQRTWWHQEGSASPRQARGAPGPAARPTARGTPPATEHVVGLIGWICRPNLARCSGRCWWASRPSSLLDHAEQQALRLAMTPTVSGITHGWCALGNPAGLTRMPPARPGRRRADSKELAVKKSRLSCGDPVKMRSSCAAG